MDNNQQAGQPFAGRVALITGAASGIGLACAQLLAERGARLCLADINAELLANAAATLKRTTDVVHCAVDVTREDDNRRMVTTALDAFGQLDAVHLNAGILRPQTLLDGDAEAWRRVIEVNLTGVFLGMHACAGAMRTRGGTMLVTASAAGSLGSEGMIGYTASKHGVTGLVKAAAIELAAHGIRVNAISPGAVYTDMLVLEGSLEQVNQSPLAKSVPLQRIARAAEVAELACFLLSDAASYMTGGIYPVDGGVCASGIPIRRH